ncbi:thiamine-phosphate kinase [Kaarinaea lacus]
MVDSKKDFSTLTMTQSEFSLIDQFFKSRGVLRDDVVLGIGDDAAVTTIPAGYQLVTAVDTLVNGVHFPFDSEPFDVGHKALAVNLSDLAAMGAEPAWATLALTLPEADENWLQQFCDGFFQLAKVFNVQLIGGDTTQGPLSVTVQIMGLVPQGKAITRSGAQLGDQIFVSGSLGDAALGLQIHQQTLSTSKLSEQHVTVLRDRLYRPLPRVALGIALRDIASSMIDISDGLAADLTHILKASKVGATITMEQLPVSDSVQTLSKSVDIETSLLRGGDDYELCFTVPENSVTKLQDTTRQLGIKLSNIGVIEARDGLRVLNKDKEMTLSQLGFEHFTGG